MPPTPKPPGQRRRRNVEQSKWRELPRAGRTGEPPALPDRPWLARTVAWWETAWQSPMATAWEDADVDGLVRLAELKDLFARGDAPATALSAMQQLEDRYGLNPKSRQQMLWMIPGEDEKRGRTPGSGTVTRLRAVDRGAA
jgi:hypothetical protein